MPDEPEDESPILEDIVWDTVETLKPGFDFKEGVTYMTFPVQRRVQKTEKVGKDIIRKVVIEPALLTVTNTRKRFWYDEENLQLLGYLRPKHVVVEGTPRWLPRDIKEWTDNDAEAPNTGELFYELRKVYEDHIEFSDEIFYDLLPMFIMGSYVFRLFSTVPYINFNGTKGSGKSQNMKILRALGFNTSWSANMSAASLFRGIAGNPGIVCVDEAESFNGERGQDIRLLLNSGYSDGAEVKRVERDSADKFLTVSYEVFGPKAIAAITPLEPVIRSRCIVVSMRPALRTIPEFRYEEGQWNETRNRLYLWALENSAEISALNLEWRRTLRFERAADLKNRYWETAQLFIILADYIDKHGGEGGLCDKTIAFLIENYQKAVEADNATDRMLITLRALPEVLRTKQPFEEHWYPLKTIHEVVSQYIEEDSKEYFKTRNLSKNLETIGFKKKRPHKQGQQIWLTPEDVRKEIKQRRVEVPEEDQPWLAGEVEYNVTTPAPDTMPEEPDDGDYF